MWILFTEWGKCLITFHFTRKGMSSALNQCLHHSALGETLLFEGPHALTEHLKGLDSQIFKTTNFQRSLLPQGSTAFVLILIDKRI